MGRGECFVNQRKEKCRVCFTSSDHDKEEASAKRSWGEFGDQVFN